MKNLLKTVRRVIKYVAMPVCMFCVISAAKANLNNTVKTDTASLIGRWDVTVIMDGQQYPSWLEVQRSGFHALVGEFVGVSGSARPVSKIIFKDGMLSFTVPPQWEGGDSDISFNGKFENDSLEGTVILADGKKFNWSAVHAPLLHRSTEPTWQKPITLFNGHDLSGWHASGKNQWVVKDGVLSSPQSGSNLLTDKTFSDFKLHIEFRYPKESNSGVYLRGRYEVQIEASHTDEPLKNVFSAVYGFIAPSEIAARQPGEWQSYDITLIGRMVTVVANGKTVICNREIPGPTGGAINSKEAEPGPLLIQGDHGPIEYRNIIITPANNISN